MKKSLLYVVLLLSLFAGGCSSFSHITVDLSTPAGEELSDSVQSLLLINRAVDRRFTDDPSDTIQLRFFEKKFQTDSTIFDLHASDTLMRTLGNLLFESGRYDVVIPVDRFPMKDTLNLWSDPMSWEEVERLTALFQTDAILSLDYHKTEVSARFRSVPYVNWEEEDQVTIYGADMAVAYIAQFRIYDPLHREVVSSHFLIDTLFWSEMDSDIKQLFRRFTYVKPALAESGIAAALQLSEKMAPRWVTSRRPLFLKGNRALQVPDSLISNHRWEEAYALWEQSVQTASTRSLKSKLLFNMAVAREMVGDITGAIRLAGKSYQTMFRQVTGSYLQTLDERRKLLLKRP